jgi:hypothetical protein
MRRFHGPRSTLVHQRHKNAPPIRRLMKIAGLANLAAFTNHIAAYSSTKTVSSFS